MTTPTEPAPKLVYDDGCRFCTWATVFVARRSDVRPVPLSRVESGESLLSDAERARLPDDYAECAQLLTGDAVYSCGAAMERSFVLAGVLPAEAADFLDRFEDYVRLREAVYHCVSDNRDVMSTLVSRDPPARKHVAEEVRRPDDGEREASSR